MLHTIENTKMIITPKLSLLAWSKCPLLWHPPHRGYREFSQQSNETIGDQIRWLEFEILRRKVSAGADGAQWLEVVKSGKNYWPTQCWQSRRWDESHNKVLPIDSSLYLHYTRSRRKPLNWGFRPNVGFAGVGPANSFCRVSTILRYFWPARNVPPLGRYHGCRMH